MLFRKLIEKENTSFRYFGSVSKWKWGDTFYMHPKLSRKILILCKNFVLKLIIKYENKRKSN